MLKNYITTMCKASFLTKDQARQPARRRSPVTVDRKSISRDSQQSRAQTILFDIWVYLPQVFVLCSLTTNPRRLGTFKSSSYLDNLSRWWKRVDQPRALLEIVERLSKILPSRDAVYMSNESIPGWQRINPALKSRLFADGCRPASTQASQDVARGPAR